ncbi:MAG: DUF1559 domain-containing protein, partial [Planctomycetaceae bacterium]|nr:DUF1559 domain-containing protein [Planctomycetaceae bacterium]
MSKKNVGKYDSRERKRPDTAFTLVELLVVIAIIGVLIALLLPAVQAAREAARRMQCTNKLKQLVLGCHNYHDIHQALPSYNCGYYGPTTVNPERMSGFITILPFIELQSSYDRFLNETIMATATAGWIGDVSPGADRVFSQTVMTYHCPSDDAYKTKNVNQSAGNNYRFNQGDTSIGLTTGDPNANPVNANLTNSKLRCRGPFGPYTWYNLSAVADGTSNTLAISERCMFDRGKNSEPNILRAVPRCDSTSTLYAALFNTTTGGQNFIKDRSAAYTYVQGKKWVNAATAGIGFGDAWPGWLYAYGSPAGVCIATIFPPNGPGTQAGNTAPYHSSLPPSSYHSGGVNAALVDGSVRFISETINAGSATAGWTAPVPSGES